MLLVQKVGQFRVLPNPETELVENLSVAELMKVLLSRHKQSNGFDFVSERDKQKLIKILSES